MFYSILSFSYCTKKTCPKLRGNKSDVTPDTNSSKKNVRISAESKYYFAHYNVNFFFFYFHFIFLFFRETSSNKTSSYSVSLFRLDDNIIILKDDFFRRLVIRTTRTMPTTVRLQLKTYPPDSN